MPTFVGGVDQGGGGLSDIVDDASPQLGANLDANSSDITGIGHIGFLATQDASAGANDLDDYEEGSWTPAITFGDASVGVTYGTQSGKYTKVGNVVTLRGRIGLTSKGSSTGTAQITGLPFTTAGAPEAIAFLGPHVITYAGILYGVILASDTEITLVEAAEAAGGQTVLTDGDFADTSQVDILAVYHV